jgi:hypothetical protein
VSAFTDKLADALGGADDVFDIRAVVRRCWFYDIVGYPLRLWSGQGRMFAEDGNEYLGTVDASGRDRHEVPALTDGRDGTSPESQFSIGYNDAAMHAALKADAYRVRGRTITCYLAIFDVGEGLRPATPLEYLASFEMQSPIFEEVLARDDKTGRIVKSYKATVIATGPNAGRSRAPRGTYTSTSQRERARLLGVENDAGCDFVAGLANRTYLVP